MALSFSLSWSAHIASLGRQVGWKVLLLKHLAFRANIPLSVLSLSRYKTLVRPCMEYASSVWDNCSAADSATLERLQLSLSMFSFLFISALLMFLNCLNLNVFICYAGLLYRGVGDNFWQLKNGFGPFS